jgi:hypothetical protein
MKFLFTVAALALISGPAQAWDVYRRCVDNGNYVYGNSSYNYTCRTTVTEDQPRDYAREAELERLRNAQIAKWEAFCKPVRNYDRYGVIRLSYARPGCEFGRAE